jgi:hypothetical protein
MLIVFFNYHRLVDHEFIPACQKINEAYYLEVLRCVKDTARRKRESAGMWHFHHDNALAHIALLS